MMVEPLRLLFYERLYVSSVWTVFVSFLYLLLVVKYVPSQAD